MRQHTCQYVPRSSHKSQLARNIRVCPAQHCFATSSRAHPHHRPPPWRLAPQALGSTKNHIQHHLPRRIVLTTNSPRVLLAAQNGTTTVVNRSPPTITQTEIPVRFLSPHQTYISIQHAPTTSITVNNGEHSTYNQSYLHPHIPPECSPPRRCVP